MVSKTWRAAMDFLKCCSVEEPLLCCLWFAGQDHAIFGHKVALVPSDGHNIVALVTLGQQLVQIGAKSCECAHTVILSAGQAKTANERHVVVARDELNW